MTKFPKEGSLVGGGHKGKEASVAGGRRNSLWHTQFTVLRRVNAVMLLITKRLLSQCVRFKWNLP